MRARLAEEWPQIETSLFRALETRAEEVTAGLERKLAARAEEEEHNIREVLEDLQRSITHQLNALESEEGLQLFLSGFGPQQLAGGERDQFQRDIEALRRRVAEIPGEVEREVAVIRRRYAAPAQRLYPAAVTFVVPETTARSIS